MRVLEHLDRDSDSAHTFTEGVAGYKPFRGHGRIAQWVKQELEPWDELPRADRDPRGG